MVGKTVLAANASAMGSGVVGTPAQDCREKRMNLRSRILIHTRNTDTDQDITILEPNGTISFSPAVFEALIRL